jgi:hypothetical protein
MTNRIAKLKYDTDHVSSRKLITQALNRDLDVYYAEGFPGCNIGAIVNGVHYVFDADDEWIVLPEKDPHHPGEYGNASIWENRDEAEQEALRFVTLNHTPTHHPKGPTTVNPDTDLLIRYIEAAAPTDIESGWWADDGECAVHYPDAKTAEEAAAAYVAAGDWAPRRQTWWCQVKTWKRLDDDGVRGDMATHTIAIDPEAPPCTDGHQHDWRYSIAAQGHGGGVIYGDTCHHCGAVMRTNTGAQDSATGEQGLRSILYQAPGDEDEDED